MPCRYEETPDEIAANKKEAARRIAQPYVEKLDKLTRLLCEAMQALDHNEHFLLVSETPVAYSHEPERRTVPHPVLSAELQAWWKKHQAEDKTRQEQELRAAALAKLTPDERKALGL